MSFSPNLFLANVRAKDGLAKPSRFEVVLPIPTYIGSFVGNSIIEKILNFPNSVFNDVTDAIGSAFGNQTQYGDISLTFLCTNDFFERKLFDRWMEAIHPSDTNNLRFPKGQATRYMTNIKIIQYDDFIKQIYAVELIDAFPIGVAPQALSWGEDGFHRLQVQFAYQKLRVQYEGTYNLAAAATALFGAAGSRLLPFGKAITR